MRSDRQPINEAGAWSVACSMFKPPREEGREALSQLQCDKGQPARSETASLMISSNLSRAFIITSGGQVRSIWINLGRERYECRRQASNWASCKFLSLVIES